MAFVETLAPYLADFGVDGTLDGVAVRGIFDDPGVTPSLGGIGASASATEPQFQLPTASVPATCYGLALVIDAGTFAVREHVPDGTGMSLLLLQRA